jgi:hypothetical protein
VLPLKRWFRRRSGEMTEAIGAAKGERSETRLSYRSGYYSRSLITGLARWSWIQPDRALDDRRPKAVRR